MLLECFFFAPCVPVYWYEYGSVGNVVSGLVGLYHDVSVISLKVLCLLL